MPPASSAARARPHEGKPHPYISPAFALQVEHAAAALCASLPAAQQKQTSLQAGALSASGVLQAHAPPASSSFTDAAAPWALAVSACNARSLAVPSLTAVLAAVDGGVEAVASAHAASWSATTGGEGEGAGSGAVTAAGVGASSAATRGAADALASSLSVRLTTLLTLGAALSAAVAGSAGSAPAGESAVTALEASRNELTSVASVLWAALSERTRELVAEKARAGRLDAEAHRALRALERLRVNHPELEAEIRAAGAAAGPAAVVAEVAREQAQEAAAAAPVPMEVDPAPLEAGAALARAPSPCGVSSDYPPPRLLLGVAGQTGLVETRASPGAEMAGVGSTSRAETALRAELEEAESRTSSAQATVAALEERLAEREAVAAEARAQAETARARTVKVERELIVLKGGQISDDAVLSHPLYAQHSATWVAESTRASALAVSIAGLKDEVAVAKAALESERRHAASQQAAATAQEAAAVDAVISKARVSLEVVVRERDEALARAAALGAENEAARKLSTTTTVALDKAEAYKTQCVRANAVLAHVNGGGEAAYAGILEEFTALSTAFEEAQGGKDSLLEALKDRDAMISKLAAEKGRIQAEAAVAATAAAAKDAVIADHTALQKSLYAQATARDAQLAEARATADRGRADLTRAEASDRARARERDKETDRTEESRTLAFQAQHRADEAVRAAEAAFAARAAAEDSEAKAKAESAALAVKLGKREEKIAALKEELEKEKTRLARAVSAGGMTPGAMMTPGGGAASDAALYRAMVFCSVCSKAVRDTCLTRCGHLFCSGCVDQRLALRSRKCPTCGGGFSESDIKRVHLA